MAAAYRLNEFRLDIDGVGLICGWRRRTFSNDDFQVAMLVNSIDSERSAQSAREYFWCSNSGRVIQIRWNLQYPNKISRFEPWLLWLLIHWLFRC